jgi:hypothetical protein
MRQIEVLSRTCWGEKHWKNMLRTQEELEENTLGTIKIQKNPIPPTLFKKEEKPMQIKIKEKN